MKAGPQVLPSLWRIQKGSLLTVDEILWDNHTKETQLWGLQMGPEEGGAPVEQEPRLSRRSTR